MKNAPDLSQQPRPSHEAVWLRLSAFLSMRSPNTQLTYKGIVDEWCRFLGAESGTSEAAKLLIKAQDIHAMAYRAWLEKQPGEKPRAQRSMGRPAGSKLLSTERRSARKKEGLESTQSNSTIAKKFAALRRIYRMLMASNIGVQENPFDTDRVPPPPKDSGRKRPTEMVDFKLVTKIVHSPDPRTPRGLRDQGILAALFGGGLRRSEVVHLRIGDVRRSQAGTVYLYLRATKGKRDAEQALPDWAAKIILQVVQQRLQSGGRPDSYLFVSYIGRAGAAPTEDPVSASGVYKLFLHYCRAAGAGPFCTPHSARATAITRLLAAGIPHREVQEFSRHSSIQMVELYDKRRIGVDENAAKKLKYEE
ncbi:MAG: tyrosine-type recombinase/integrase [Bdellovibrionota bacterium]|nr:MAG: tyrosine-type recombinase/integrase [Bdellovibrionota bacterium]